MQSSNLDTREKRERRLRMMMADPVRRPNVEPHDRSYHVYERDSDRGPALVACLFWGVAGLVVGFFFGLMF